MKSRGVITLVFDDGYSQVYNNVVPLLNKNSMKGVFGIPLETEPLASREKRPIETWIKWQTIKSAGHEIAAHSITHRDLTSLTASELERELAEPANTLQTTTLIYPGGAHNDQVVEAASRHYSAARTVQRGIESKHPQDLMRLKSFNFTRQNFSVWKANLLALYACLADRWLIETYHMVNDEDFELTYSVPLSGLTRHLAFIRRLPIEIKTIKEMANHE